MIILKTMDICEECPNFDAEVRDFFKSLGLKIVLCKKYKECHKNLKDWRITQMVNNEQIINLQDKLIKGYRKEIDLLKRQNALLRENREKYIHLLENYKKVNELLKEQNALLSEMVERKN